MAIFFLSCSDVVDMLKSVVILCMSILDFVGQRSCDFVFMTTIVLGWVGVLNEEFSIDEGFSRLASPIILTKMKMYLKCSIFIVITESDGFPMGLR